MSPKARAARYFAAVDLGASSGRVVAARLGDDSTGIRVTEVHRFGNGPVLQDGVWCWAVDRLFEETLRGLALVAEAAREEGAVFAGVGVDSWGVDYGLLDANGDVLPGVTHHRGADPSGPAEAEPVVSAADAYRMTGVPPQAINTSYRLRSDVRRGTVRGGERVLLIPDLWVHLLTGLVGAERTIASTTQLFDPRTGDWSSTMIKALGLEAFDFPPATDSGTFAGYTTTEMTTRLGAPQPVPVYRVAGHDTASAFAFAKPDDEELLISSGSWSLAGVCLSRPILSDAARAGGFTNEAGVRGSTLCLRNLAGMWLLTECTRLWAERGEAEPEVGRLVQQAASEHVGAVPIFDVADPRLLEPGDMPARIAALCSESGQEPPLGVPGTVRSIIESLAAAYAETARACERLTGIPLTSVRIVGGGSRNDLLCRRTAELTGLPVTAGPAEASALGNLAVQLVAARETTSISAAYARFDSDDLTVRMLSGRASAFFGGRTFMTRDHSEAANEENRRTIAALSRELGRPDRDWALLAEGNTSMALGDGRMLVKASGVSMATATPEDFVTLGIDETLSLVDSTGGGDEDVRALFDAAAVSQLRPSVEALLHAVCLGLPGVLAVGHTHPIPVNALLCSARASALTDGSLFPDQIVVLGVDQLLVPYVDPGLRLAQVVRSMLREHVAATGTSPKVIYLRNHGMFALGASDREVLQITEMAVKVARVILGTFAAGGPVYLKSEHVARIDTRPDELLRRTALIGAAQAAQKGAAL